MTIQEDFRLQAAADAEIYSKAVEEEETREPWEAKAATTVTLATPTAKKLHDRFSRDMRGFGAAESYYSADGEIELLVTKDERETFELEMDFELETDTPPQFAEILAYFREYYGLTVV